MAACEVLLMVRCFGMFSCAAKRRLLLVFPEAAVALSSRRRGVTISLQRMTNKSRQPAFASGSYLT
jgi:hypothetical protein